MKDRLRAMAKTAVWAFLLTALLSACAHNAAPEGSAAPAGTPSIESPVLPPAPASPSPPMPSPPSSPPEPSPPDETEAEPVKPVVLAFAGDLNLDDNWGTMQTLRRQGDGLAGCIARPLLDRMAAADIFLLNNEFAFSERGAPMNGKLWTFRAKPENVGYLLEMGVDIVSLGNNHVFDYGADAFLDTLDTLTEAGIAYVGAGRELGEAMQAQYFTINGMTIAYVAASRAEKYILTPEAKADSPGILRAYDPALLLEAVKTAGAGADVVVAYLHWGTEYSTVLEPEQTRLARDLIDSGADLVVGAHPHCLQGIEYYNGKPIVYSLGNFWFNDKTLDTALLEVTVHSPGELSLSIVPCLQKGFQTTLLTEAADRRRVFDHLMDISPNGDILIGDDGAVTAAP